jgi:NAD(P)-dependent dehydrogenase (short-subunit alcohol dehydrogenase family)
LLALTKVAAQELAPLGIRVNALIPPATRTELNREFFAKPEVVNAIMERLLIKRIAEPDEIADAFIFLASDASRFMTGQALILDGGYLAT